MSEREDEQAAPGAWASRGLFDVLFTTDAMRRIFSDQGRLQGLLDFEAALARAEARIGVIPPSAAAAIATQCRAELFDMARLADAAGLAGNLAIPAVKELTALVAGVDPAAARFVHWGATSQDAMDSGLVLQVRDALDAVEVDLDGLSAALGVSRASAPSDALDAADTPAQTAAPVTSSGAEVAAVSFGAACAAPDAPLATVCSIPISSLAPSLAIVPPPLSVSRLRLASPRRAAHAEPRAPPAL